MDVKPNHILWAAGLFLVWRAGVAVAGSAGAAGEAVREAYGGYEIRRNDFFARLTGLDAEQNRILNNPDYARLWLLLE